MANMNLFDFSRINSIDDAAQNGGLFRVLGRNGAATHGHRARHPHRGLRQGA